MRAFGLILISMVASVGTGVADETELPAAKPVPLMQAVPLPGGDISIRRDGRELTRFRGDNATQRRTFWYPVLTSSSDRSLTRMGHPRDPVSHSHHNSVWITHHDLEGVDFWGDHGGGKGQIDLVETRRLWDGEDRAGAETVHRWKADDGGALLLETRRWEWVELGEGKGAILSLEIEAVPSGGRSKVTFRQTPFGVVGVRMAKTIGVRDGGGRILNSGGAINEKAIFRKPARWVDYSGPLRRGGGTAGITLMNHPSNPDHPAPFHVREDGWMGVCLTLGGPLDVTMEEPLGLRYGLWIHDGVPSLAAAEAVWAQFAEMARPGAATAEREGG